MSKLHKVSKWAGILHKLTIAAMVVLPVTILTGLVSTTSVLSLLDMSWLRYRSLGNLVSGQVVGALALGLINPLILLFTLNQMRKLFAAYTRGEVLTDHCAWLIQRIGKGFLALAIATFLIRPMQILLLTMALPQGQRSIAIGLNSEMIFFAISGGLIIVIGWAMREASAAAEENRAFV